MPVIIMSERWERLIERIEMEFHAALKKARVHGYLKREIKAV